MKTAVTQSKFVKYFCWIVVLILVGAGLYLYENAFRSSSIISAFPQQGPINIELPKELEVLFEKPLRYLGEGNQAYAFVSEGDNYVVKFFKAAPLQRNRLQTVLSKTGYLKEYLQRIDKRRKRKFDRIFNAYDIAYRFDRHYCGLSYVHLEETSHLGLQVTLIDAYGFQHLIDLDKMAFVIQKKCTPLNILMKREMAKGKINFVKEKLQLVIDMYLAEYAMGIFDHDHNLMVNIGFTEGQPMRLDVGKLVLDPSYSHRQVYLADLEKIIQKRIAKWFQKNYPDHANEILQVLEPYLLH